MLRVFVCLSKGGGDRLLELTDDLAGLFPELEFTFQTGIPIRCKTFLSAMDATLTKKVVLRKQGFQELLLIIVYFERSSSMQEGIFAM